MISATISAGQRGRGIGEPRTTGMKIAIKGWNWIELGKMTFAGWQEAAKTGKYF